MAVKPAILFGGVVLGVTALWLFTGTGSASASTGGSACSGVDGLREPLRTAVKQAMADPNTTADQLNALANQIDAIPAPYQCPQAAYEVRQAAYNKALYIQPTPGPGPTPPPASKPAGCSPSEQQVVSYGQAMTSADVAKAITGSGSTNQDSLVSLNHGYKYRYLVVPQPAFGKNYFVDEETETDTTALAAGGGPGATAQFWGLVWPAHTNLHIPTEWNQYFGWNPSTGTYDADGSGNDHAPCP